MSKWYGDHSALHISVSPTLTKPNTIQKSDRQDCLETTLTANVSTTHRITMNTARISVALCTHNGAPFLWDLLYSLATQTLLPFELIACDDASSDETLEILNVFASSAPFPVHIHTNSVRQGVVRNFEQAISFCSGQIIALSDQDDIWHPNKLAKQMAVLANEKYSASFCNADVVDEELRPMGYSIWDRVGFSASEQRAMLSGTALRVLLKHDVVTGTTLIFRAELRTLLKEIPDCWPHDAWIAILASIYGHLAPLPETLLAYRQHKHNVVGGTKKTFLHESSVLLNLDRSGYYRNELLRWQGLLTRMKTVHLLCSDEKLLLAKLNHLEQRANLPSQRFRRIPGVLKEILTAGYFRYARNWGSVAMDLLVK